MSKEYLFPYTPSQYLIWANFEKISPNPGEGDALPYYLAPFFGGKFWWELYSYQIVFYINKPWSNNWNRKQVLVW